jgi:para-nitrobenzyl esterase
VFIWIHGGAYCCGSGAGKAADPATFLDRDIVYVSFNYRIGILGFFAHPELSDENAHHVSGNYGHYDQFFLLQWVRENIAAFGGDSENITVGGCSAGSGSTAMLAASPLTKGMIRRVINESSLGIASAKYPEKDILHTLGEMEQRGIEFMRLLGCRDIADMRALPYKKLAALPESSFRKKYHYGTTMAPVTDKPSVKRIAGETHLALAGAKAFAAVSSRHGRQPVYLFDFCRKDPEKGAACHGLETQYLFGHQRTALKGTDATDDAIAKLLQDYWCNFIRTGNPNGGGLPVWTPYTADDRRVLYIDAVTSCRSDAEAATPLNTFARDFLEAKMEKEIEQLSK